MLGYQARPCKRSMYTFYVYVLCTHSMYAFYSILFIIDEGHFDFQNGRSGRTISLKRECYIIHDLG